MLQGTLDRDIGSTFVWRDVEAEAGKTYEYRLGVIDRGREVFVGNVSVSVPVGWELGLVGVNPNPTGQDAWVTFTLPTSEPATLSMHDIAGRGILSRHVGSLGAGRHVLNLVQGHTLPPGLYLIRLEQAGKTATRRICVIR
jgi:hypothetical protein